MTTEARPIGYTKEELFEGLRAFVEDGQDLETTQKKLGKGKGFNSLNSALNYRGIRFRKLDENGNSVTTMRRAGMAAQEIWGYFTKETKEEDPAPTPPEASENAIVALSQEQMEAIAVMVGDHIIKHLNNRHHKIPEGIATWRTDNKAQKHSQTREKALG